MEHRSTHDNKAKQLT